MFDSPYSTPPTRPSTPQASTRTPVPGKKKNVVFFMPDDMPYVFDEMPQVTPGANVINWNNRLNVPHMNRLRDEVINSFCRHYIINNLNVTILGSSVHKSLL